MQRIQRITLIALAGIIAISVLGLASLSLARLGYTAECGGCHNTSGVLTLTSDAGGTIAATIDIPFTLEVYSTGYLDGDTLYAISLQAGWADNDEFSFTASEIQDQGTGDTNSSLNAITASFEFTPLSTGSFTIRIWVAAADDLATSLDVAVEVLSGDSTPPTIDSPPDKLIALGDPTESITWNPYDENPNRYEITDNSALMRSGPWSGSSITVMLDTLTIGVHNIVLTVWDDADNSNSDTVVITVADGDSPTIDHPADIIYDEGETGNSITWTPYDASPESYVVYFEGVVIKSNSWNASDETINVSVDGLSPGSYNYTISVTDTDANTVLDTVFVHVNDITPPTIDSPGDFSYAEDTSSNSISWNPFDLYPSSYEVLRNGELVYTNTWSASPIVVSVDGLTTGVWNFTIIVYDTNDNTASDTVMVTVYDDTAPVLDSPDDFEVIEGSVGTMLSWSPFDLHPSNYVIYREDLAVKSGLWNSSTESISISMNGLTLGDWNFTIVVYDETGLSDTDTVIVTVFDGTAPTTTHPDDSYYAVGQGAGFNITWSAFDLHPVSYSILANGSSVKSGLWNSSGENIFFDVSGLPIALHNFILAVTDVGGTTAFDTVFVTVFDTDLPYVDHPSDQFIIEDSVGNLLVWHPLDLNPKNYTIYRDGTPVQFGLWNDPSETISISLDGFNLGTRTYRLVVYDEDGNTADDYVLVTTYDGTAPTVNSPADVFYNEGESAGSLTWQPYDKYPNSYRIYRDGTQIRSGNWNSNAQSFSVSVSGLAYGVYNYTFWAIDDHGNTVTDSVNVTVLDGTHPVVDDQPDVEYNEGDPGGSITWNPTDLHPISYEILKDGIIVKFGAWNSSAESISISITGLSAGSYNYTLVVYDIGMNSGNDTVLVTVLDAIAPIIDSIAEPSVAEGTLGSEIVWTPYDLHPYNYTVFQDGIVIKSGLWNSSSESIVIPLHTLILGEYNFSLIVFDESGNNATDLVQVTIYDGTSPTIDAIDDFSVGEGEIGDDIEWIPYDLHPSRYEIFIDGNLVKAGVWNSSDEPISISLDGLTLSTYQIVLIVYDIVNNTAYDSVKVTVLDVTAPLLDSPSDVEFVVGETGESISWSASDLHPSEYLIFRDGLVVENDTWSSGSIVISLDGLSVGSYNYTILISDVGGNSVSDYVNVVVTDIITTTGETTEPTTEPTSSGPTESTPTNIGPPVTPPPLPPYVMGSWIIIIATWALVFVGFFAVVEILKRKRIL